VNGATDPTELIKARDKIKKAQDAVDREESNLEILKENFKHAESLKTEAEDFYRNNQTEKARRRAKEAITQAEEVLDGGRRYGHTALLIEVGFSVATLIIVFYIVNKKVLDIPNWVFIMGFMGALVYSSFGVNYQYYKGEFSLNDIIYYFSRLIQGTLLAVPIYLILIDLTASENVLLAVDEFKFVLAGNGSNVTLEQAIPANITTSKVENINTNLHFIGAACFLTGFFSQKAVGFLKGVADRLFKISNT
jgi:hypothetical protein